MRRTVTEAAETRRKIVDAALLAFAENGWEGATFDGIATLAGLTRGAVHHHFRTKEELLRSVLWEHWAVRADVTLAPLRENSRIAAKRLTSFVANYLHLVATDKGFRALATITTVVAPRIKPSSAGFDEHRRSLDLWRDELRTVLKKPGTLRPGVRLETAVFVIVNFLIGATVTVVTEPDGLRTASTRSATATALISGLVQENC